MIKRKQNFKSLIRAIEVLDVVGAKLIPKDGKKIGYVEAVFVKY